MKSYSLRSPAKINLYLEIVGDRPDGFHELATIFQSIDLADIVHVRSGMPGVIRVECGAEGVPNDATNLAYRAASLMSERFPEAFSKFGGVAIEIDKQIPVAAGLAGGSGNGAAVLVGLDLAWGLGLTQGELQELAAELGSDVPFCVGGGTALATGRGEVLDPLAGVDQVWVVLAKYRSLGVSTPWAYKTYRSQFGQDYARTPEALAARHTAAKSGPMARSLQALAAGDRTGLAELRGQLRNDLERVVLPEHPQIAQLRSVLDDLAPLGAMMSGSGPSVFALAASEEEANQIQRAARSALPNPDLNFWVTQFSAAGIRPV
ncbi:MAG: 4-(cytidine 5'-diphospho)-2-C-methyl-D-erythritol kinase [Oscillatoriales cyanobacterium]|nr:MAG: 4-(cytidine 5'-diphospho)-2-C-methyl-D-erythritol kinase [Oscillatoriales cyanobacterium]